jgi:hypothetical protein
VEWDKYLAPWIDDLMPGTAQDFMYFVGAVEIAAGLLVAVAPHIGAYVVAAWLGAIVVNLLTADPPRFYDIALRDFGLLLGALTLARLATSIRRHDRGKQVRDSASAQDSEPRRPSREPSNGLVRESDRPQRRR